MTKTSLAQAEFLQICAVVCWNKKQEWVAGKVDDDSIDSWMDWSYLKSEMKRSLGFEWLDITRFKSTAYFAVYFASVPNLVS